MVQKIDKLKGKELADYVEKHKEEFEGNGDKLCLAAGYGVQAEDGNLKCDFGNFVKAVSVAEDISD